MGFRTKVTLLYVGVLTLIIVAMSAAIVGVVRPTIVASIDKSLRSVSATVRSSVHAVSNNHPDSDGVSIHVRGDEFLRMPGISVQIWQTANGSEAEGPRLITSSRDLEGIEDALDPLCLNLTQVTFSDVSPQFSLNAMPLRVMTHPVLTEDGQNVGVIQVAASAMIVDDLTNDVLSLVVVVAVVGVLIAIILGWAVAYEASRPLQEMTAAAGQISTSNDLTTRLPAGLPNDEIGKVARAFNHMMARLERLFAVQQSFISDLSHELRTPLTAIRGNLDLLKRYGRDEKAFDAIETETRRMTRMVDEVLLLARVDSGHVVMQLRQLDLDALLLDTFNSLFSLEEVKDRNLSIKLDKLEKLRVVGDAEHLQLMTKNVIANAIRYTPDGGEVVLSLYSRDGRHAIIEVQDSGIGIDQNDITRIFDRFYQVDSSRANRRNIDGAGLGLSIVKWVVDSHGGDIEVESQLNRGTTFRIVVPLTD